MATSATQLQMGYVTLMESFLRELTDAFPECTKTEVARQVFCTAVQCSPEAVDCHIRAVCAAARPVKAALQSETLEALLTFQGQVEQFRGLDLAAKVQDPDLSEASRHQIWQYLKSLLTYAEFYSAVPSTLLTKLEGLATTLSGTLGGGSPEAALAGLLGGLGTMDGGLPDLTQIGQNVLNSFAPEELQSFEESLPQLYEAVGSLSGLMGIGDTGSTGDGFDPAQLLRRLTNLQGAFPGNGLQGLASLQGLANFPGLAGLPGMAGGADSSPAAMLASLASMLPKRPAVADESPDEPPAKMRRRRR